MNRNRLAYFALLFSRLRAVVQVARRRGLRAAHVYLWVHAFTRDSGLAMMDPLIRLWHALAPYPETIEIETTTRCHLKCTMCEHTYWNEPSSDMSYAQFTSIIDQFPRLKWLGMTGIGSNFLNRDFFRMLEYALSRKIFVEFFDTFDLIDEKAAEQLITMGLNKIWMSIDGATAPTYNAIRVGTSFEKVTRNAMRLMELKKEKGTLFPEVWFHYIISKDNYRELPEFVRLVHRMTAAGSNPATMIYFTNLLHFEEVENMRTELPREIVEETMREARRYGIFVGWNPNIRPTRCVTQCTRWTEPFVLATGHVQTCCAINEANTRQYQKDHSLGNLFETPFREIWKKRYPQVLGEIRAGRFPEICRHCRVFLEKPAN